MGKSRLGKAVLLVLAAGWLAACGRPAAPTSEPTSPCPASGSISVDLATPQPAEVLLEFAWEGGFTRPEMAPAFGRVPEFSLLPNGQVYYLDPADWDRAQVMVAFLAPAEADELVRRALDAGLDRLEGYADACQPQADGTCLCVADAGTSVLRVRPPGGELRTIRNYAGFARDPAALEAVRALFTNYQHPVAKPYFPEAATLFVRAVAYSPDLPLLDWPLAPDWIGRAAAETPCARAISGSELRALLAAAGRNRGDFTLRGAGPNQAYNLYLAPWLPGVDYSQEIAGSGQACR